MNAIEMSDVAKRYDSTQVLDGFDLSVRAGEVFALLGPNGAGKTTAVEILEGYRTPDSGTVRVLGMDPAKAGPALRSRIGIVLQHTTSFEHSTVQETVDMFAALFPNSMPADDAIELVGLGPQRDQISETMSGGQRRRLDVACGLVGRPDVLFLDEPTTGLDPEARRSMWQIISSLRDRGATVLLTTHYLDEAEALADRIAILIDGRIQDVASPDKIAGRDAALARVRFVPKTLDRELSTWDRDGEAVWSDTDRPAQLVAELVAQYGELDHLTIARPSLEDVYLTMVNRSGVSQ